MTGNGNNVNDHQDFLSSILKLLDNQHISPEYPLRLYLLAEQYIKATCDNIRASILNEIDMLENNYAIEDSSISAFKETVLAYLKEEVVIK